MFDPSREDWMSILEETEKALDAKKKKPNPGLNDNRKKNEKVKKAVEKSRKKSVCIRS